MAAAGSSSASGDLKEVAEFKRPSAVYSLVVAGDKIVSAEGDGDVHVLNLADGTADARLQKTMVSYQTNALEHRLALLADGRVAESAADGEVVIWDLSSKKFATCSSHELWASQRNMAAITALPDGGVISGTKLGTSYAWDGAGTPAYKWGGYGKTLATLPDGRVVGSMNNSVAIWTPAPDNEYVQTELAPEHAENVTAVGALECDKVVSADSSGELSVWDIYTTEREFSTKAHDGWIRCITPISGGRFAVASADKKVTIWARAGAESKDWVLQQTLEHEDCVAAVCALPSGGIITGTYGFPGDGSSYGAIHKWE